jgi:cell wall-associated NlpC family hydrolase
VQNGPSDNRMNFGICNLSVIPGRIEPSDKSEMITQLLFGEHFTVLRRQGNWLYIRCAFDNYECWIDIKQCQEISLETFTELESREITSTMELMYVLQDTDQGFYQPVVIGSSLPYFDGRTCNLEGFEYAYDGQTNTIKHGTINQFISETAYTFLNAPYLWGGRSPLGIDCSGFTQVVFKIAGQRLERDAYQQADQGTTLGFIDEAEMGDLAFFDNEEGKIIHVGILLGGGKIIHASGRVRIDRIDHQGIFNEETGKYTHQLRIIKRVLGVA